MLPGIFDVLAPKFVVHLLQKVSLTMGSMKRGALIVVEGVDRSGKSTQCKKLVQSLEKQMIKSKLISFPDRSTLTGKLIDEYLRNKECKLNDHTIHLLFSANRWENFEKIKSSLYDGVTLVIDRYSYSGIVFSGAKKSIDIEWCEHPENGLPKPDMVFLLTLNQEEMQNRPGFGEERYENITFQRNVANLYESLCDEKDNWVKIDASGTIDEVHTRILKKCLERIENVGTTPLQYLNFDTKS